MVLVAAAVVWGGPVFVISFFVALPLPRRSSPAETRSPTWPSSWGYGTFLVEHLIFGLFLGLALVKGFKRAR